MLATEEAFHGPAAAGQGVDDLASTRVILPVVRIRELSYVALRR